MGNLTNYKYGKREIIINRQNITAVDANPIVVYNVPRDMLVQVFGSIGASGYVSGSLTYQLNFIYLHGNIFSGGSASYSISANGVVSLSLAGATFYLQKGSQITQQITGTFDLVASVSAYIKLLS